MKLLKKWENIGKWKILHKILRLKMYKNVVTCYFWCHHVRKNTCMYLYLGKKIVERQTKSLIKMLFWRRWEQKRSKSKIYTLELFIVHVFFNVVLFKKLSEINFIHMQYLLCSLIFNFYISFTTFIKNLWLSI